MKVYFSPRQEGSGTPSPENIRPITGWTGIELSGCGKVADGKNLLTLKGAISGMYIPENGVIASSQAYMCYSVLIPLDKGSYVFSGTCNIAAAINTNIRISTINSLTDGQIERGSTPTAYEPYRERNYRIPDEYQEVEYLESTGTQWIATNYIPTDDVDTYKKVTCEYAWTTNQTNDSMLFGYNSTNSTLYYERYAHRTAYSAIGLSRYRAIVGGLGDGQLNTKYNLIMDEQTCEIVGGTSATPTSYWESIDPIPMYIFAWNNKNKYADYINCGVRIYSLTFIEGDSMAANFVPCYRKSDNEPGMYDTVSGNFYTNSGTGEFLVGNNVNTIAVDWSESVGTVYGGYVDLISGELVETWACRDMSTFSTIAASSSTSEPWVHRFSLKNW